MGPDIEITAPDGSVVVFPAGTPDDVIQRVMAQEYGGPEDAGYYNTQDSQTESLPGATEDNPVDLATVGRQQAAGLRKGDWVKGPDGTVYQLPDDAGTDALRPTDEQQPGGVFVRPREIGPVEDFARSIPTGLGHALSGIIGSPEAVRGGVHNFANWERDVFGIKPNENPNLIDRAADTLRSLPSRIDYPTTAEVDQGIQNVTGDYYQPRGVAGEYGRTLGEFAPGALAPGGLASRVASVAVPALTSETAGQLARMVDNAGRGDQRASGGLEGVITGDTAPEQGFRLEPFARVAGGVVGGLGVGGTQALRSGATRVLRNATEGVTPGQLQMAEALAARSPVPLTTAERLQQVTGGATGLGRVQRVVEGSNTRLAQMLSQRPAAVEDAVTRVLDQIAPPMAPQAVAGQTQEAASGVLNTMRQRVNESARPMYDRLPGQTLGPDEYAQLANNPSYAQAQEAVRGNPELAALLNGPPQDLSTVNRVVQQLDQMAENARPGQMNPQGNNTLASQRDQAAALARQLASEASPDFALARQTVATGNEAFVDPLKRGPLGALANQQELQPNLSGQLSRLFPNKPPEGAADETRQALQLMGQIDQTIPPSLIRQHLATEGMEALQRNVGGANEFGGAKFAAQAFGNPEQERNIIGAIDAISPQASRDARDLVEALRATGQREGVNSNTSFNNELQAQMAGGNVGQNAVRSVVNPAGIPGQIARGFDDFITRRNANRLADFLLADPAEASRLVNAARAAPRGGNRIRLATALSASQQDRQ